MSQYDTHHLEQAACTGDLNLVQHILCQGAANMYLGMAVVNAAMNGHAEVAVLLAGRSEATMNTNALARAAQGGFVDVVNGLLPYSDLRVKSSYALRMSMETHHLECIDAIASQMECQDILTAIESVFDGTNEGFARVKEWYAQKKAQQEHGLIQGHLPGLSATRGGRKI